MYINLHQHSHYSLMDGLSKPNDIASRAKQLGQTSIALTDHGGINGAVEFQLACKKEGIKPIQGVELYICKKDPSDQTPENRDLIHLVVLAKNYNGWKTLLKIIEESNRQEYYYYKPRISLQRLGELNSDKNLVSFSGHLGSTICDSILEDNTIKPDWQKELEYSVGLHEDIFGPENFFIEIQTIDSNNTPICKTVGDCLREWSKNNNRKTVATADSHYTKPDDIELHQIILASAIKKSVPELKRALAQGQDIGFRCFFTGNGKYHIPSFEEMKLCNTEGEIENTVCIADMCEEYDITNKPFMPKFSCPDGLDANSYLERLCEKGLQEKNLDSPSYRDRLKHEFAVINRANLASYFLVVQDYVNWAQEQNILTGPGRGSAGGCLVSYLTKITRVDPLKYNLIFERFYNDGRNTPERVALPDIDVDFPVHKRDEVVEYIRDKYGRPNVTQIAAYGRMMGRGALKDVLRAFGIDFGLSNEITKWIPGEAEVADEINDVEDHSIIRWTLENRADKLAQWCEVDENAEPKCEGDMGIYFRHAIKLEGTKRSASRHPAGIIICDRPLLDICPMIFDSKSKQQICGWDLKSAEGAGLCKVDCLSVASLDKIGMAMRLINASRAS